MQCTLILHCICQTPLMNHRSRVRMHVVLDNRQFWTWTLSDCFALQVALKCADIGHLAATPDVHKRWAYLLDEEFFLQVLLPANTACLTQYTVQDTHKLALTHAIWVLYGCCMYAPGLSHVIAVQTQAHQAAGERLHVHLPHSAKSRRTVISDTGCMLKND